MSVDQERNQFLFRKLGELATKLGSDPLSEDVHQFRTIARRIETLFGQLVRKPDRNERKLLKQLRKIRKRAGRVRDLDVQMAALRNLRIGRDGQEKRALMNILIEDRARHVKELISALDDKGLQRLRKRLRRAAQEPRLYDSDIEPVTVGLRLFARLPANQREVTEALLHQYRLNCKCVRYIVEMAGRTPQAEAVVEQLKAIQDGIGDWHDWDTLTTRAEVLFADVPNTPLVTALRAVRYAKMKEALTVTQTAKAALLQTYRFGETLKRSPKPAINRGSEGEQRLASAAVA